MLRLFCIHCLAAFVLTLAADGAEKVIVLSDFDQPGEWKAPRWNKVNGKLALRPEVPPALKEVEGAPDKSLGVKVDWPGGDGFLFFNVIPEAIDPIAFNTKYLNFWYSGSGTGHILTIVIEDSKGKSHKLSLKKMDSTEWKKARIRIPSKVAQPFKVTAINQHNYGVPDAVESTAYFSRLEAVVDPEMPLGSAASGKNATAKNRQDDW